jgi:hypothetical protein
MIRFTGRRGKVGAIMAAAAVGALVLSQAGTTPGTATRQAATAHDTANRAVTVAVTDTTASVPAPNAAPVYNGRVSNNGAGATMYDYPSSGTPNTSLTALGSLADGTQVSIQCYLTGTPVIGPNGLGPGNSDVYWDQVTGASSTAGQVLIDHAAVVPDAYIDTGSETVDHLVPACASASTASPPSVDKPISAGTGAPGSSPPSPQPSGPGGSGTISRETTKASSSASPPLGCP